MPDKRQHTPKDIPPDNLPGNTPDGPPRLAIRRHTDRCFHEAEEVVYDAAGGRVLGYILDGVMVDSDDVAEVRPMPK